MTQKMTDDELERAIAETPFEKVTKESITAKIRKVEYFVLPNSTNTVCSITMENGFGFLGKSACVDHFNFVEEIGREVAYRNAFEEIWAFEGYLMADRRFQESKCTER